MSNFAIKWALEKDCQGSIGVERSKEGEGRTKGKIWQKETYFIKLEAPLSNSVDIDNGVSILCQKIDNMKHSRLIQREAI